MLLFSTNIISEYLLAFLSFWFVIINLLYLVRSFIKKSYFYSLLSIVLILIILYNNQVFSMFYFMTTLKHCLTDIFYKSFSLFNNILVLDTFNLNFVGLIILFSLIYLLIFKDYITKHNLNSLENSIFFIILLFNFMIFVKVNDLIIFYLVIELQNLIFYILSASKKTSLYATEGSIKYFILGAISSGFLLLSLLLIYALLGTTNFNYIYLLLYNNTEYLYLITLFISIFTIVFLFKIAAVPFHIWSLDVYEGSPTNITLLFLTLPKIILFFVFFKIFHFIFINYHSFWKILILISGVLTLLHSSILGLNQIRLKRLFIYSSINHVGYLLLVFFIHHYYNMEVLLTYFIFYILTSFLLWTIFLNLETSKKFYLTISNLINLANKNLPLAIILIIGLFSFIGLPPLIGFFLKFFILTSLISNTYYLLSVILILFSLISSFYYLRLIKITFFEKTSTWLNLQLLSKVHSYIIMIITFLITGGIFLAFNITYLI